MKEENHSQNEEHLQQSKEAAQTPPAEQARQDNRLTKAQKLFFLLVVLFTVFLLFLKLVWEPRQRGKALDNDSVPSWDPGDYGNYNPEDYGDYNPEDYGDGSFVPGDGVDWPENPETNPESVPTFGPQPE